MCLLDVYVQGIEIILLHTTVKIEFTLYFNVRCDNIIVSGTSLFNLSALVCII